MSKGRENYLKPLKPQKRQKRHATFDVESNKWTKFEMGGFYDGTRYFQFNTLDELVSHILKKRNRSRTIFAHNGGRFDFLFIMEYLRKVRNQEVRMIVQGPRITALKIKSGKQWITLQDSFTLLSYSLDELSKAYPTKTKKMTGAIDFKNERVDKNNPIHQEYLKNDCIVLYEIIDEYKKLPFVRDVGLKLTRSSVGLAAWRTTLKEPIKLSPDFVQNFCRESYAGGRCEIFKIFNQETLQRVDANSLYPSQMLQPLPLEYIGESTDPFEFGFHDITVEVPECYIPILWQKTPRLIFPTGTFRGVYFSEEIKLAVEMGAKIKKYHGGYLFSKDDGIFREYINTAYKMRLENPGENPKNILAKDLMNHTYGKTAEREEKKTLIKVNQTNPESWPKEFKMFRDEKTFKKFGLVEITQWKRSPHMLVHIASAITTYGRIHMAKNIYIPFQKTLHYTDTDSGDVSAKQKIEYSNNLGDLKKDFKGRNIDLAYYLVPKGYYLKLDDGTTIKKIKGFSKKALESITYEMFKKGNIKSVERKISTFKTSLIRENSYLSLQDFKKSIISEYNKRKMLKGGETRPWHITTKGKII